VRAEVIVGLSALVFSARPRTPEARGQQGSFWCKLEIALMFCSSTSELCGVIAKARQGFDICAAFPFCHT
jgi:hypothetical protein